MSTFIFAISCLTTSNLPWFTDLTFQVPMQYCSLQHWTLLLSPVTSTTGCCFHFGSVSSFLKKMAFIIFLMFIYLWLCPKEPFFLAHEFFVAVCGFQNCGMGAWFPRGTWNLSSLTKDGTHVPWWSLNHWTTREIHYLLFLETPSPMWLVIEARSDAVKSNIA